MNALTDKAGSGSKLGSYDAKAGLPAGKAQAAAQGSNNEDMGPNGPGRIVQHEGGVKFGAGTGPNRATLDAGKLNAPAQKVASAQEQVNLGAPPKSKGKAWK